MNDIIQVMPYKSHFFLSFKSSALQRWAARITTNDFYYALTPVFWRRVMGSKPAEGIVGKPSSSSTIYFVDRDHAEKACLAFLDALDRQGILRKVA